jgi:hypothetical protein
MRSQFGPAHDPHHRRQHCHQPRHRDDAAPSEIPADASGDRGAAATRTGTAKGEIEKPCPYIVSSQDQGPDSLADLEGDRVYRTTVLTGMSPPGCRFYFWAAPYEAIAEIATRRFSDSVAAHDAMVRSGEAGTQVEGKPDIVPGVDAVLYRTRFFGPDGARDWACVFAKGKVMVTVRTQRADTSLNALLIAQAIAPKF